jgi:pimeloyl-ACP methyl ester carboxylesterase
MTDADTADRLAPPAWFSRAVTATPDTVDVHRDGRSIRVYRWGDPAGRPLVLLHGFGANAHWWDHIAPQLVGDGLQVAAIDLAGHGASDYSEEYTLSGWAADVEEVCRRLSPMKPLLVGHSAGGRIVWKAAELHGTDLLAVVSVDGPLPPPAPQPAAPTPGWRRRQGHRVYRDRDEIIGRFRPLPDQELVLPYVLQHIAERSVRPLADGWTWAHDTKIYQRRRIEEIVARPLGCPIFMVIAENGRTSFAAASLVRREVPQMSMLTIPEAGHHIMLDQPLALVSVLRLIIDLTTAASG